MNRPLFFLKKAVLVLLFACIFGFGVITLASQFSNNPKFLIGLPFAGLVVVFMALNFRWAVILILLSRDILDPVLEQTKAGGAGIGGLLNLFVILMVVVTALRFPDRVKKCRFLIPWGVFLVVCLPTIYYSPDRPESLRLWLTLLTYACMFLAPFLVLKNEKDKAFWVRLMLISSVLPMAIACGAYIIHHRPMMWDEGRLNGTFAHANILAFYTVLMITLILYVLKTGILKLTVPKKVGLLSLLGVMMVVLLLTQTRSAWVACFILFFFFSILKDKKILIYIFIGALLLSATPPMQKRIQELTEGTGARKTERLNSMAWRVRLWKSSFPTMMEKPVFGHGLGSFPFYSKQFFSMGGKHNKVPAHNVYVEMVYESGFVGLLAYLFIFVTILKVFFKRMRVTRGAASVEATLAIICVLSYLVVSYSDNMLYYLAFNWYFWFFCGLMLAAMDIESRRIESPEPA